MLRSSFEIKYLMENFKMLSPFKDETGVIRAGVDKALVSYPILLPNKNWIYYLITCHMHQFDHCRNSSNSS